MWKASVGEIATASLPLPWKRADKLSALCQRAAIHYLLFADPPKIFLHWFILRCNLYISKGSWRSCLGKTEGLVSEQHQVLFLNTLQAVYVLASTGLCSSTRVPIRCFHKQIKGSSLWWVEGSQTSVSSRRMEIMRSVSEAQEVDQVLFLKSFCKQCFHVYISVCFRKVENGSLFEGVASGCIPRKNELWTQTAVSSLGLGKFPILSFTLNMIFLDPTI